MRRSRTRIRSDTGLLTRRGSGRYSRLFYGFDVCNPLQTMYRDMTGSQKGIESLNKLSETIPIGVIFGDKNDYM